jgi:hypothetical protein
VAAMWVVALLILGVGAIAKPMYGGFESYLVSTGMFAAWSVPVVSRGVVGLEAATCVLLIWPRLRRLGWIMVAALGSSFATIHVAAAFLGDVKPCRCFAVELSGNALWNHIGMAVLCVALVVMAFVGTRQRQRGPVPEQGVAVCAS